jgi:hypothetical protein
VNHVGVSPVAQIATPWAPITQYSSVDIHQIAHAPTAVAQAPSHVWAAPAIKTWVSPVVHAIPAAASYTAANRGSVHTAPLPGHAISQTSLNLAPAPGTW